MIKKYFPFLFLLLTGFAMWLTYQLTSLTVANKPEPSSQIRTYSQTEIQGFMADLDLYGRGKFHYKTRCSSCHGFDAEGGLEGPSLQGYTNQLAQFNVLYEKIYYGNPAKRMPAWGSRLQERDLQGLAVYLLTP